MDCEKILELGVKKNIISQSQKLELQCLAEEIDSNKSDSAVIKFLYYVGGFIMLCAMTSLMSHTIQHNTYAIILVLGILYAILFLGMGEFLYKKNEKLPAGILYFLFITTFSFIILDVEKMIGFFPHFSDIDKYPNFYDLCRLPMSLLSILTIIANSILQKYRKVSLLALPSIICSYSLYMTILHYFFGDKLGDTILLTNFGLIFSIALILIGFIKDRQTEADYSKWLYFVGAIGLYETLFVFFNNYFDIIEANDNIVQFQTFLLSSIYFLFGILIQRKPFKIIGIFGIIEYIIYLEFHYIKDNTTLLTSFIIATGLLILYAGYLFHQNSDKITSSLENLLPMKIKQYLPQNRDI